MPPAQRSSSDSTKRCHDGVDLSQAAMAPSRPSIGRQLVHTQHTFEVDAYHCVSCNKLYFSWASFIATHDQCSKAGGANPDGLRGEAMAELRRDVAVCFVPAADGTPSRDTERPTIPRFTMPYTKRDQEAFRRQKKVPNTHAGRHAPVTCCASSQGTLWTPIANLRCSVSQKNEAKAQKRQQAKVARLQAAVASGACGRTSNSCSEEAAPDSMSAHHASFDELAAGAAEVAEAIAAAPLDGQMPARQRFRSSPNSQSSPSRCCWWIKCRQALR